MSKLVRPDPSYWPRDDFGYWCPACSAMHVIQTARWSFDGNLQQPTFSPSINYRVNTPDMKEYQKDISSTICHHFVRAGKISYCGDCTHSMRGQTTDLPDFPEDRHLSCRRL